MADTKKRACLGNTFNKGMIALASNVGRLVTSEYGAHGILKKPMTAYKQVECYNNSYQSYEGAIAEVLVPAEAKVVLMRFPSGLLGAKFRTNKYRIVSIETMKGEPKQIACSSYDQKFKYRVGHEYSCLVDLDLTKDCSYGLHFVLTKDGARHYQG